MMFKSAIVAVLATVVLSFVAAEDTRMDYKLAKGQTVAQFCAAWNTECYKYIPKVQPGAEVGEYCEAGPGKDEVQTYCNAYAVTLHGSAVAKILHAVPA
ncbi:hypothetical protein EMPS_05561 [Entomortierella parvispora]|uniref:Uncharacterized protein n=1 Tax=Entomortierella parvispora TaxID=205924 RepID=A0A9P3HB81_9FUNG|nr:hypothetical protein EMPS_05561 [Entomortierella parvispora]